MLKITSNRSSTWQIVCVLFWASSGLAIDPLKRAKLTLASGLASTRFSEQVQAENLANINTTSSTPGGDPYVNKIVQCTPTRSGETGALLMICTSIPDQSNFNVEHNPSHPAADPDTGIVKKPNVEMPVVMADINANQILATAEVTAIENIKAMEKEELHLLQM